MAGVVVSENGHTRRLRLGRDLKLLLLLCALALGAWTAGRHHLSIRAEPSVAVEIPSDLSRRELADVVGEKLSWGAKEKSAFASAFAQMQWAEFNRAALALFTDRFAWDEAEQNIFAIHSTSYLRPELDFLSAVYEPGAYVLSGDADTSQVAGALIERVRTASGGDLERYLSARVSAAAAEPIAHFVEREGELLPDLVPLPPRDVVLEQSGGKTLLRFSTIYYNRGEGPLELRADPATAGRAEDTERTVFQRIYRADGGYRDRTAGTFLWHQEHLHYHFADFVTYRLEAVEPAGQSALPGTQAKSTFCIRDVSRVDLELVHRASDAAYQVCGKERQGISVGWADTYFYTYPDQLLDISDLPSGTYRLSFHVNPSDRFEEVTLENNHSSTLLSIDREAGTLEVLEEVPVGAPEIEHVYPEQVFE